jgi:hypothetical protein
MQSFAEEPPAMATVESSPQSAMIKVAVIEDRREIREGLKMLINGTDSYRCTGLARRDSG